MKEKITKIIKSIGIGGIAIGIFINVFSHKIEDINFFQLAKEIISKIVTFLLDVLSFKISLWIIFLVIITIYILKKLYTLFDQKNNNEQKKEWENYKKEKYEGLTYTWDYVESYEGRVIDRLRPICDCGCELINQSSYQGNFFVCPNCGNSYKNNFNKSKDAVQKLIVFKHNKMIEDYRNKNKRKEEVNLDKLTSKEKDVLKMFYKVEQKVYTNCRVPLNYNNYGDEIDSLMHRGILKKQNEMEMLENYTSKGVLFELTEEALDTLNTNKTYSKL